MHFSWLSEKAPTPEATWADHSYYFRPYYYKVTVSERDHVERTHVYFNETIIPENQGLNGSDFLPLNFKSSFSIVTHQGKSHDPAQYRQRSISLISTKIELFSLELSKRKNSFAFRFDILPENRDNRDVHDRCRQWTPFPFQLRWLNPQKCGSFGLMTKITPANCLRLKAALQATQRTDEPM